MALKLFTFDKYKHVPDTFEKTVAEFLRAAPDVAGFKAFEDPYTGNVIFAFEMSDKKTVDTEIVLVAWIGMDEVERLTNNLLARIDAQGKRARHVKIIPLSRSPRVMVAALVETSSRSGTTDAELQDKKTEQNEDPNAGPNEGTKRRRVRRNRKDSEDGTT